MLFKRPGSAPTEQNLEVEDLWINSNFTNATISRLAQLSLDQSDSSILKSQIVDFWDKLNISEVCRDFMRHVTVLV